MESTYKFLVENQVIAQQETQEEEDEYETLTMADVKFSSCTNLPSALACC